MNPIPARIAKRLAMLPKFLSPVADAARRRVKLCCAIHNDDVFIAHQPWQGLLSYEIVLFAPAKKAWFAKYARLNGIAVPPLIQKMLLAANGFKIAGIDLFGMTPSMLQDPPLLNRSVIQCLDLSLAQDWTLEYARPGLGFHFGSRDYSYSEALGYFLNANETIQAVRKNGSVVGEWTDMRQFLKEEIPAAEKLAQKLARSVLVDR